MYCLHKLTHISLCKITYAMYFFSSDCFPKTAQSVLSEHQQTVLNHLYSSKPYPTNAEMEKIASMLGLESSSVFRWFNSQRFWRKVNSKNQSHHIPLGKNLLLYSVFKLRNISIRMSSDDMYVMSGF